MTRVHVIAGLAGIAAGAIALGLLLDIYSHTPDDVPPPLYYFIIGGIALLFAVQDARLLVAGLDVDSRVKRHLVRMGTAMFIATGSLFLGQPQVFVGSPIEWIGFRTIPVLLVIAAAIYWYVRASRRHLALRSPAPPPPRSHRPRH